MRIIRVLAIPVAVFALSLAASAYLMRGRNPTRPAGSQPDDSASAATSFQNKTQLALVYIGRASCRWCTSPEMHRALDSARVMLRARGEQLGVNVRVYGIGIDFDMETSFRHLKELGPFDAVHVGDRWNSLAAGQFAWGDMAGPRATPQLILIERQVRSAGTLSAGFQEVLSQHIVARKLGLDEIVSWVGGGLVVDHAPESARAR